MNSNTVNETDEAEIASRQCFKRVAFALGVLVVSSVMIIVSLVNIVLEYFK